MIAQFSLLANIGGCYCYYSAFCSFMGNACMLGGYNDVAAYMRFCTTFNPNPNTWEEKALMREYRICPASTAFGGKIEEVVMPQ